MENKTNVSKWINHYEFMLEHAMLMEGNNSTLIRVLNKNIKYLKQKANELQD